MIRYFKPKKCICGNYPVFKKNWSKVNQIDDCYFVCKCGLRTKEFSMPYLACDAWNNDEIFCIQINLFDLLEC